MIRVHSKATGEVQGVGFRYYAQECAALCNVTGWVKNEWDGSVTLEAQGETDDVSRFLAIVRLGNRFAHVERMTKSEIPLQEGERGFHIRY